MMVRELKTVYDGHGGRMVLTWEDDDTFSIVKSKNNVHVHTWKYYDQALALNKINVMAGHEPDCGESNALRNEAAHIKVWDEHNIKW